MRVPLYAVKPHIITKYMQTWLDRGSVFFKTKENWYPSFPDNYLNGNSFDVGILYLAVTLHDYKTYPTDIRRMIPKHNKARISVWGADDFGMEKVFTDLGEAREMYRNLPEFIEQDWLRSKGFINA